MKLTELYLRLQSLAIFRSLLSDPVLEALVSFLGAGDTAQAVSRYAEFVCRLYATGKRPAISSTSFQLTRTPTSA